MNSILRHSLLLLTTVALMPVYAETGTDREASNGPYASWDYRASDDDSLAVEDSFNYAHKNSERTELDVRKHYEANQRTDIEVDKDYTSNYLYKTDDDYTSTSNVDVDDSWQQSTDVDLQLVTPTLTSNKDQRQDAGHGAYNEAYGYAQGHRAATVGGTTVVHAANDEQVFLGVAMVNNNTNQLPQNNVFSQGNAGPVQQDTTFAGRDLGPKGVFAPVGNTMSTLSGSVGQGSSAAVNQSGDAHNGIADALQSDVSR